MVFIPKAESKFRPLCIGSRLLNLFSSLVANRLNNHLIKVEEFSNRFGFIKTKSVDLLHYNYFDAVNKAKEMGLKTNVVNLDLKSAFTRVPPVKLLLRVYRLIRQTGNILHLGVVLGYLLRTSSGLVRRKVLWFDFESNFFRSVLMKIGLCQGDSLAPLAFIVYFNYDTFIGILLYFADDNQCIISSTSWATTDYLTELFVEEFTSWTSDNDMIVCESKSVILCIARRNPPAKIAKIPTSASCRNLGVLMSGNNAFASQMSNLQKFVRSRAAFLVLLRKEFNVSFKVLLNICLAFRSKFVFGSFYILQLSWCGYNKLCKLWWLLVRRAVGFNYLVPQNDMFNYLGILSLENFLTYWYAKWHFTLEKFKFGNIFSRVAEWDCTQVIKSSNYNFRSTTRMKSAETAQALANNFRPLQIYFARKIRPHVKFIETLKGTFDLKTELKNRWKVTRVNKLFTDLDIKSKIRDLNEIWYKKKIRYVSC